MGLHDIAYKLRKMPKFKKFLKDIYQYVGYIVSDKKTTGLNIEQISNNKYENLFGYYDKCPWNKNEDKMLYMRVNKASKFVSSKEEAKIILKDLSSGKEKIIDSTRAWNVQQGSMLQWLGPDFNSKILYNDYINNELKTIIYNLEDGIKKIIDSPVYDVTKDGKYGLTLDFFRLNRLRPGYGYCNKEDLTKNELIPDDYCIWKVDLINNTKKGIITYKQLYNIDLKESMIGAEHKVNHIMINPSGNRFMFLHRWIKNGVKNTRLLTADIDGGNVYNLLDEDMVSHCIWKNDKSILGWARKENIGNKYFLLNDKTNKYKIIGDESFKVDGHPSYRSDGKIFVTDTYPDFKRKQHIYIYNEKTKQKKEIASIFANIKYKNDCRCDLHPRWNYSGTKICFDGAQKKKRQVYVVDVGEL